MRKAALYMVKILILFVFGLNSFNASAGHAGATEITYRWIDTLTYEVQFVYYRYCAGIVFSNPSSATKVVCYTSGSSKTLSLTLQSVKEVRTFCDTLGSQCAGSNQNRSGDGVEALLYLDTVDFRTTKYKSLISSGCTKLRFETSICCRNSDINTGAANSLGYNYAYLDVSNGLRNSSPSFDLDPVVNITVNTAFYYSISAADTVDGDSLSYNVIAPLKSFNSSVSVAWPPITAYYPGSLKPPYHNPNANPPIGFFVDPQTGDVIATPTKSGEKSVLTCEVKEWRKDSTGKYVHIGTVTRDMIVNVVNPGLNNSPLIRGKFSTTVCVGEEICFTVTSEDKIKVPPPPLPKPNADTTFMTWNRGIPGATFKIINDSALNQSGKFCWVPKAEDFKSNPYQFVVEVRDNHCPIPSISSRAFQVKVNNIMEAKIESEPIGCGMYTISSQIDSNEKRSPRYHWTVIDTSGAILTGKKAPIFLSTQNIVSTSSNDTVRFKTKGTYIVRHVISGPERCETAYYDTIVVNDLLEVSIAELADTFICQGSTKDFVANLKNASTQVTYEWSTGDTTSSIQYGLADSIKYETIILTVKDTNGCTAAENVTVINRPRPTIDKIGNKEICFGDSLNLTPSGSLALWDDPRDKVQDTVLQGSKLSYLINDGKTINAFDSTIYVGQYQNYEVIAVDSLSCTDTTSFNLSYAQIAMPNDMEVCADAGRINLRLVEDVKYTGGTWSCPSDTSLVDLGYEVAIDKFVTKGQQVTKVIYYHITHSTLGCELVDSFNITVNPLPNVLLNDLTFCQQSNPLDVVDDGIVLLPSASGLNFGRQKWRCVDCGTYNPNQIIKDEGTGLPGGIQDFKVYVDAATIPLKAKSEDSILLSLQFSDVNGCVASDTMQLTIKKRVDIDFNGFSNICWDEGIVDLKELSEVTPYNGIWRAVDSTGFANAKDLNSSIKGDTTNGDTLNSLTTPRPSEGSEFKYMMRYFHNISGCESQAFTPLVIRGLPQPIIDRKPLSNHSSSEPFAFCISDSNVQLSANYSGGVFNSTQPSVLDGSIFKPFKSSGIGNVFDISYLYTDIHGCRGGDTVSVVVNDINDKLDVSPQDTSLTWYSDNMSQWVIAAPKGGRGVKWEALDGGFFDNDSALTTRFNYTTNKEVTSIVRVRGTETESQNACPAASNIINLLVHRTPCIDFIMDLDLSAKSLKLTPEIDSLASYQWTVKDSNSFDVNAIIDVSAYTDSLVNVRLQTHNKGGDNCYTDKVLNLKNGSISPIDFQEIVLYPNPVLNGFTIQMKGKGVPEGITIYDALGAKVSNFRTDENYVDCSDLSSGIYSVVLTIDSEVYVTKFVKKR